MPKKNIGSLYPTPTRDRLKAGASASKPPKRSVFHARDYAPATLLGMTAVAAIVFGVIGFLAYYYNLQKMQNVAPQDVAIAVAKKVAEFNPTDPYDVMESEIEYQFKECRALPVLTITHYLEAAPANHPTLEYTTIDLNEKDIPNVIDKVLEKSETATKNELDITCPV